MKLKGKFTQVVKRYQKKDPFTAREAEKYENPVPSREHIIGYLEDIGCPVGQRDLEEALGIEDPSKIEVFSFRLRAMERDGQLMRNRRGRFTLVDRLSLIKGTVRGHREGYGLVLPDDGGDDIFLAPWQMRAVFHGDRVLVRVSGEVHRGRREGVIIEIIEHAIERVVGRYFEENGARFVSPESRHITQDILIPDGAQKNAEHGQFVQIAITQYPTKRRQALGEVMEVLGDHMAPGLEVEIAIRSYDLPFEWSSDVKREIQKFSKEVSKADKEGRRDLAELPFVTIDGEDAKDFDDAVYCHALKKGWRLYVAIADVGHYISTGSALDSEAYHRGNSVYFPNRVIPMLPEKISNGLCSLMPNVDRLAMVCEMEISQAGKLEKYRFYQAVIHSHARLTYSQVNKMILGEANKKSLLPEIMDLYGLYKKLIEQRKKRGALEFETTETRIIFDETLKIEEIVPQIRNEAHKIIEECMLLANVSTASFLQDHKMPTLYRVHKGPNPLKLAALREFVQGLGLTLGGGDEPRPLDYAGLLEKIKARPDEKVLNMMLLRSLSQAQYTPEKAGHFGLAYDVYVHFTSPIRRYPDLLVHRAIAHILQHEKTKGEKFLVDLKSAGEQCSKTERRADEATRDVVDWLKCEYMVDKVGQEFEGTISSVTSFGIFTELKDIYVEGLTHISDLSEDYYTFDPARSCLQGRKRKNCYCIGDSVRILVARVDLDNRYIDFQLV